ncbi:MAG: prolyl oligopeptidase family serine peptidase, partial [Acidobacteria bacterium]|nr:prolyl oligopeptidase family serine peptidase [Acidobacteriota bacterium]
LALTLLASSALGGTLHNRSYVSPRDGAARFYDVYTPTGYRPETPVPAILFLHGRGGSKNSFQTPAYFAEADRRGFALVFWQGRVAPWGGFSTYYVDGVNGFPDETDVLACLEHARQAFSLAAGRVHLAGFSQGGRGALLIGLQNPGLFASVIAGAAPTDAFQGQLWSRDFPDYESAAGTSAVAATGAALAAWFELSPRFLLENARNVPLFLAHGLADDVVPDDVLRFPYRNTRNVADTPGFRDVHGITLTLSELAAGNPGAYVFDTYYPSAGHEQEFVLPAAHVLAFATSKVQGPPPTHEVLVGYSSRSTRGRWLTVRRASPPNGTPHGGEVKLEGRTFHVTRADGTSLALDVAAAGLAGLPFQVISTRPLEDLALTGSFGPETAVRLCDASTCHETPSTRTAGGLTVSAVPAGGTLSVVPSDGALILESDLLVPAMVRSPGVTGAFSSELVLANTGGQPLLLELVRIDAPEIRLALPLAAFTTTKVSAASFLRAGETAFASPVRIRVLDGRVDALAATAFVSQGTAPGAYGFSFPVRAVAATVVAAGKRAYLFGRMPSRDERMNVSLFAPLEPAEVVVIARDELGVPHLTQTVTLAALERRQLNDVVAGIAGPSRVELRVVSGRVAAYGTVISNSSTGDPYQSPVIPRFQSKVYTIPAVAAAAGRNGAVFSSDLFLGEGSEVQDFLLELTLTYRPIGGAPQTADVNVLPGTLRYTRDVLRTFFPGSEGTAGSLEVRSRFSLFEAFAVTRSDSSTGPASQDLQAVPEAEEITFEAP